MSDPIICTVGIIMNGVTGRMGANQHLLRSIVPIIKQGGVKIRNNEFIMPDPILVGRDPNKLKKLSETSGINKTSTDLSSVLIDPDYPIYFDAQTTERRMEDVEKAIKAGKHVYCEKPVALTTTDAISLYRQAVKSKVKTGVVQDKLWLPGFRKLKKLITEEFFGRILAVRGEFGYWVFNGETAPPQRPSWNYRAEDGGGIVLDMFPHWRYIIDDLFGKVKNVFCSTRTHIPERRDENGEVYQCTADDAAYALFETENGILAQFNSSWSTRVKREDLLRIQVDGEKGSAVAGLRKAWIQPAAATPRAIWNPDIEQPFNFDQYWQEVPDTIPSENAFKAQWEIFLKHITGTADFPWNLLEGAKGVQLAELAWRSDQEKRWVEVPEL